MSLAISSAEVVRIGEHALSSVRVGEGPSAPSPGIVTEGKDKFAYADWLDDRYAEFTGFLVDLATQGASYPGAKWTDEKISAFVSWFEHYNRDKRLPWEAWWTEHQEETHWYGGQPNIIAHPAVYFVPWDEIDGWYNRLWSAREKFLTFDIAKPPPLPEKPKEGSILDPVRDYADAVSPILWGIGAVGVGVAAIALIGLVKK